MDRYWAFNNSLKYYRKDFFKYFFAFLQWYTNEFLRVFLWFWCTKPFRNSIRKIWEFVQKYLQAFSEIYRCTSTSSIVCDTCKTFCKRFLQKFPYWFLQESNWKFLKHCLLEITCIVPTEVSLRIKSDILKYFFRMSPKYYSFRNCSRDNFRNLFRFCFYLGEPPGNVREFFLWV